MKVSNLGANQTEVGFDNGTRVLVSYKTPVAAYVVGRGYIRTEESWSNTTSKHISMWGCKDSARVPQQTLAALLENGGVLTEPTVCTPVKGPGKRRLITKPAPKA